MQMPHLSKNGMSIAFEADSNHSVLVLDRYIHLPNGAMLAKCKRDDIKGPLYLLKANLLIGINFICVESLSSSSTDSV